MLVLLIRYLDWLLNQFVAVRCTPFTDPPSLLFDLNRRWTKFIKISTFFGFI